MLCVLCCNKSLFFLQQSTTPNLHPITISILLFFSLFLSFFSRAKQKSQVRSSALSFFGPLGDVRSKVLRNSRVFFAAMYVLLLVHRD